MIVLHEVVKRASFLAVFAQEVGGTRTPSGRSRPGFDCFFCFYRLLSDVV